MKFSSRDGDPFFSFLEFCSIKRETLNFFSLPDNRNNFVFLLFHVWRPLGVDFADVTGGGILDADWLERAREIVLLLSKQNVKSLAYLMIMALIMVRHAKPVITHSF